MSARQVGGVGYAVEGPPEAPALVLLHALGTDRRAWGPVLGPWASSFRVVCVDLPGHGASRERAPAPTIEALADAVLEVVEAEALATFVVGGISLGGQVALHLAATQARVTGLVVAASSARIGEPSRWQMRIDGVEAGGMASIADVALARFFTPGYAAAHPEVVAECRAVLLETGPAGYAACCAALRDADLTDRVAGIRAPTLLLAGGEDTSVPPAALAELGQRIAGARLEVLEGAGHLFHIEAPAAVGAALARFLGAEGAAAEVG